MFWLKLMWTLFLVQTAESTSSPKFFLALGSSYSIVVHNCVPFQTMQMSWHMVDWAEPSGKKKCSFSIWVDNTDCLAIWLTCGGANILWKAEGENQKFAEEEELVYMWIFNHHHGKLNYCSLVFIAFKENPWTLGLAKENISGWDMTEAWKEPIHSGCSLCTSEIHHRKNFLQAAIAHSAWAPE